MSRILLIGYGPLPQPGLTLFMAPSLRTRHLAFALRDAGCEVHLYTLPLPGTEGPEGELWELRRSNYEGLTVHRFTNHSGEFAARELTKELARVQPAAIVGVNTYPSYVAAMLPTAKPFWADLNGYWMAERQGQCRAEGSDAGLDMAWRIERTILRRCDKFSAVSRPQLHAVLGEMASLGRLNRHTFEYPFGAHLPNAAHRWPEPADPAPVLRGPVVPPGAFVILWSGGFNIWTDVDCLMKAMNELMGRYEEVHFVSTGGALKGVDGSTYERFERAVAASPHRDRFHLMGWVPSEKLPLIYREADLGLNIDGPNYETVFGARNRINAMAAEGLAVLTTLGTEISEFLDDAHAALTIPMRDPKALMEEIEPWVDQKEKLKDYSRRARKMMEADFSYEATTSALRSWAAAPRNAPDNEIKIARGGGSGETLLQDIALNPLEEQTLFLERNWGKPLPPPAPVSPWIRAGEKLMNGLRKLIERSRSR